MVKTWEISVKDFVLFPHWDPQTEKKFMDTKYSYGKIIFKGTEDECAELEQKLFKAGAKILGSSELGAPNRINDFMEEHLQKRRNKTT